MNTFQFQDLCDKKKKVVFIMGATGTGKSRLSVDIATHFCSEIINSDKMQVYKGLDIATNKVTESEMRGVPHHLLGVIADPDADFSVHDFCLHALAAIKEILGSGRVPVIVGGSNSYIEALVEDELFKAKFDCCFMWLDVSRPILHSFVSKRVDQMVNQGLVDEARELFVHGADYTRGIRRSIGAPELDKYFKAEMEINGGDEGSDELEVMLKEAIEEIKMNTCKLIACQVGKIERLKDEVGWIMHRIDATQVFEKLGGEGADQAWDEIVKKPCLEIVAGFLKEDDETAPIVAAENNALSVSLEELQVVN